MTTRVENEALTRVGPGTPIYATCGSGPALVRGEILYMQHAYIQIIAHTPRYNQYSERWHVRMDSVLVTRMPLPVAA